MPNWSDMIFYRLAMICAIVTIAASCSKAPPGNAKQPLSEEQQSTKAAETKASPTPALASKEEQGEEERESKSEPTTDQIGEDCVAFVRSTKTVENRDTTNDSCPQCPPAGTEVLRFDSIQVDDVTSDGSACEIGVTIRATFNPSKGGASIGGGLTGWISPQQRAEYLRGQTPAGQQTYKVKVSYRRRGHDWRAVEFH